jgi:hypothetical protein
MGLPRQDIADALKATIGTPQAIPGAFGRPAIEIPRYTAVLDKVGRRRSNHFGKHNAALIDDGSGFPTFAELLVAARLRDAGWESAWISTYGGFRAISAWPWDAFDPTVCDLPFALRRTIDRISGKRRELKNAAKPTFWGIPDVIIWRGHELLMVECKRGQRDRVRSTQQEWVHSALLAGLVVEQFGIFEWCFRDEM